MIPTLTALDRESAIRELAAKAAAGLRSGMEEKITNAALTREEDFGTAVGCGVALPHARLENIDEPIIAFGRSRSGLYWNSPDGKPVYQVFFLVSPSGLKDVHVEILAVITKIMQKSENRTAINRAADADLCQTIHDLFSRETKSFRHA
ncbi:PTS sugar transporter subunit IIA [bacterium]|nr:PTS sugar transporter subunit IIA [bacterium]